ncbi:hypothetical protein VDA_000931 [Photobacterium damselae subsp. damselae CIP 102761]|uniref:Uncharacterized protein n=1 Tax=Photobacterium damselae subsp. damselae CIP 102761 TaxID=675817 RepID=D0Z3D0_PHODD|nr:hypothetical protein VDA_000931 [Photobacterium damselae subsp. damselae CIP 102761]
MKYKDKHYTVEVHVFKTIVAEIVKKREFKLQGMQAKDMELG